MLNTPVMKFLVYDDGTITALRNECELINCINGVSPSINKMCKINRKFCVHYTFNEYSLIINNVLHP